MGRKDIQAEGTVEMKKSMEHLKTDKVTLAIVRRGKKRMVGKKAGEADTSLTRMRVISHTKDFELYPQGRWKS